MGKHDKQSKKAAKLQEQASPPRKMKQKDSSDMASSAQNVMSSNTGSPLFFFKEDQGNGFLCQWYRCSFRDPELDGLTFNCAEQYMMYKKAMLFNDTAIADKIMRTTNPRKQKALAREVADFNEARWCEHHLGIVRRGNMLKFTQSTNLSGIKMDDKGDPLPLKELLFGTKDQELVEASPFDRVWGIGYKVEEALTVSRQLWGENLLGKVLMQVRSELREAERKWSGSDTGGSSRVYPIER